MLTCEHLQVKFSMYVQYLRAMGWTYSLVVFLMYFIQNVAFIGSNFWLSDWTNDADSSLLNNNSVRMGVDVRVGVFGALGVAQGKWEVFGVCCLLLLNIKHRQHSRSNSPFDSTL